MKPHLPFRLGSTSYVYPADILPNVQKLAEVVDDIELVLFEVDDQNNLPSPEVIAELNVLAAAHNLSYTVHLPLDLRFQDARCSDQAGRVIRATRALAPWAFIVHLDGSNASATTPTAWLDRATYLLELIGQQAGDPALLAIENLENYDPALFLPLLDRLPVSLCIDIGHLLKTNQSPLPYLLAHLNRTRVIHLHGCQAGRDHLGLDALPANMLDALLRALTQNRYNGVLTLEVFNEQDFFRGRDLVLSVLEKSQ